MTHRSLVSEEDSSSGIDLQLRITLLWGKCTHATPEHAKQGDIRKFSPIADRVRGPVAITMLDEVMDWNPVQQCTRPKLMAQVSAMQHHGHGICDHLMGTFDLPDLTRRSWSSHFNSVAGLGPWVVDRRGFSKFSSFIETDTSVWFIRSMA